MSRRVPLIVAGWFTIAATAIGTGLAAVQVIGSGIGAGGGTDVISPAQAARDLAAAGPLPSSAPTPSSAGSQPASPAPDAGPTNRRSLAGPAGSVIAGCTPAGAVLVSWTPAQGYSVERHDAGPGEYAEVRFRANGGSNSGRGNGEVRVRVRCVQGEPTAEWS
jgi:hypothetical protein